MMTARLDGLTRLSVVWLGVGMAAAMPGPSRAAECTPILKDGATAFETHGSLALDTKEACFSFVLPKGSQFVAISTTLGVQHMETYVTNPGGAEEHLVDMSTRFDSADTGSYLSAAGVADGERRFRIVVKDPIAKSIEPFGLRISVNDPADRCAPATIGPGAGFRVAFPAPQPLHDRCWIATVPPEQRVRADLDPQPGVLLSAEARPLSGGTWSLLGEPGLSTGDLMNIGLNVSRQVRLTVYANPREHGEGETVLFARLSD